jgi:uncharacterized membrane protein YhaH (DUF805 family)
VSTLSIVSLVVVGLAMAGLYIWLVATSVFAMVRILNRTGYSGWWLLVGFVPVVGVIALSRFSKAKWSETASEPTSQKSSFGR